MSCSIFLTLCFILKNSSGIKRLTYLTFFRLMVYCLFEFFSLSLSNCFTPMEILFLCCFMISIISYIYITGAYYESYVWMPLVRKGSWRIANTPVNCDLRRVHNKYYRRYNNVLTAIKFNKFAVKQCKALTQLSLFWHWTIFGMITLWTCSFFFEL